MNSSDFQSGTRDRTGTALPIVLAVVDGIRDATDQLERLAQSLEAGLAPNVTPSRLLMLAGPLLAQLASVEREAHRLSAFAAPHRGEG